MIKIAFISFVSLFLAHAHAFEVDVNPSREIKITDPEQKLISTLDEVHRVKKHQPESPRTNPPLTLPKDYSVTGKIVLIDVHEKNYSFDYSGSSLYEVFKSCQNDLKSAGLVKTRNIYVKVKSDKIHQEQHLCPDKKSEELTWVGASAICEQIAKELAVTHGLQSNCSRYPHNHKWWKTIKTVEKEIKACPTGKQGQIVKIYEKVQQHQCLFAVSEALDVVKRGDLINEKNFCKMIPKDCHVHNKIVKHGEFWSQNSNQVIKTLTCPAGFHGHKQETLQMKQKYVCDNGKVLSVGQPYSTDIVLHSIDTCKAPMKRCGAHAHNDEWEVRVGRKVVKKSCIGGKKIEISYPKLRTMVCNNGTAEWKDNVVNVGSHKVFPSQSCKDSPYSTTLDH